MTFNGNITPTALPRSEDAPVEIVFSGKVRTLEGNHAPPLREMVIKLNRNGKLDTRGLPICRRREIEGSTSEEARKGCGDALVGSGAYVARTEFPEQRSYATNGRILAFNTTLDGHPGILAHVYSRVPIPTTRTFVFSIRHTKGTFGTVLTAQVPPSLNRFGYLKRISLKLHRIYTFHGHTHSYLSAGCPAPAGLTEASFSLAYTSMTFGDGRVLWSNLTRVCRVK